MLRAIASQQGLVIAAGRGGKIKTALQLVGIAFLLVHFEYPILFFDYQLDFHEVGIYLLYLSLVMSVLSAFEYFKFFAEAAARHARGGPAPAQYTPTPAREEGPVGEELVPSVYGSAAQQSQR